jgi:hypothetical protein
MTQEEIAKKRSRIIHLLKELGELELECNAAGVHIPELYFRSMALSEYGRSPKQVYLTPSEQMMKDVMDRCSNNNHQ